jgi:hypothetical protein
MPYKSEKTHQIHDNLSRLSKASNDDAISSGFRLTQGLTNECKNQRANDANSISLDESTLIYLDDCQEEDMDVFEVDLNNFQQCTEQTLQGSSGSNLSVMGKREYRAWIGKMGLHIS